MVMRADGWPVSTICAGVVKTSCVASGARRASSSSRRRQCRIDPESAAVRSRRPRRSPANLNVRAQPLKYHLDMVACPVLMFVVVLNQAGAIRGEHKPPLTRCFRDEGLRVGLAEPIAPRMVG